MHRKSRQALLSFTRLCNKTAASAVHVHHKGYVSKAWLGSGSEMGNNKTTWLCSKPNSIHESLEAGVYPASYQAAEPYLAL